MQNTKTKATKIECTLFLCAHYAQKGIDTKMDEWVVLHKYKNLDGNTSRDYYHEELGLEAIVTAVENKYFDPNVEGMRSYTLDVMENASYMVFVRQKLNKPVYYFAPFVNNNGFIIYVEDARRFDHFKKFEEKPQTQKPYVLESLKKIFKGEEVVSLREDNMFVSFPTLNIDEVCKKLMKKHWKFTPEFFEQIQSAGYMPYNPEVEYISYSFPEHNKMDKKSIFENITEILNGSTENFKRKDYAKVKSLIEKLSMEELLKIKKISFDLDSSESNKINKFINSEINKKRSFKIFNKIANGEKLMEIKEIK